LGGCGKKDFHKPPQALARKRYVSVADEKNLPTKSRLKVENQKVAPKNS